MGKKKSPKFIGALNYTEFTNISFEVYTAGRYKSVGFISGIQDVQGLKKGTPLSLFFTAGNVQYQAMVTVRNINYSNQRGYSVTVELVGQLEQS